MNFLAHLHCSPNHPLIRVFNFTADGVRGNLWKREASAAQIIGVDLHRFIDHFTDEHPLSKKAKKHLRNEAGKTAPIALDLLGDHFLLKHWTVLASSSTGHLSPKEFIVQCYRDISEHQHLLVGKAARMWPFMHKEDWLSSYADINGVRRAALGMSVRHPAIQQLGTFFDKLDTNDKSYKIAEQWFIEFYPKLFQQSQSFIANHPVINKLGL